MISHLYIILIACHLHYTRCLFPLTNITNTQVNLPRPNLLSLAKMAQLVWLPVIYTTPGEFSHPPPLPQHPSQSPQAKPPECRQSGSSVQNISQSPTDLSISISIYKPPNKLTQSVCLLSSTDLISCDKHTKTRSFSPPNYFILSTR